MPRIPLLVLFQLGIPSAELMGVQLIRVQLASPTWPSYTFERLPVSPGDPARCRPAPESHLSPETLAL